MFLKKYLFLISLKYFLLFRETFFQAGVFYRNKALSKVILLQIKTYIFIFNYIRKLYITSYLIPALPGKLSLQLWN